MKIVEEKALLTLPVPSIQKLLIEIKNDINFYFRSSLWYLKKVSAFSGTKKKCENKKCHFLHYSGLRRQG